jgi:uracil phosphoribosyltransferase
MGIVIEEALASVETVAYDLQTSNGQTIRGVKSDRSLCCVSVGHKGLPLVRQYRLIDPRGSVGCIQLVTERYHGKVVPVAHRVELPREMTADSCVLLFACSTATGESVCTAIHALLEIGVDQANVRVVVLVCSSQAVELICHQFPHVRMLTCAVESNKNDTPLPTTLSDFLERYEGFQHHTRMSHTAVVRPLPSPFLHARKRPSLSNRWENTETVRPFVHRQQIRDPRRNQLHG